MKTYQIILSVLLILYTNDSFARELPLLKGKLTAAIISENFFKALPVKDDDPLNGPKKEYYPNGKIMKEYTLKDGKIDGSYKFYNSIGKLVSDQYFRDGMPDGYLKTYYESGQLKSEGNMKPDGDISGPSKEYYEDGTLKKESNFAGQAPKFTGQTKSYSKKGQLINQSTFSQGELVYSATYDEQGRVTFEDKPGQSISYSYDRDGKRHVSINGVPQD